MASLPFIDQTITFSNPNISFKRLDPITDFRQCHGVHPPERRILYRCRRLSSTARTVTATATGDNDYILKVKVQIPDPDDTKDSNSDSAASSTAVPGPSDATTHELEALQLFRDGKSEVGPHLIAFQTFPQGENGLLPGGYISYTVMSKLPGKSLFDLGYWSLSFEERAEIQEHFLEALRSVLMPITTHIRSARAMS